MARPLSEDRRNAILNAATVLIAEQGLGASTADIAKRAGISNGSLFTYFGSKVDLVNALYLELKTELTDLVLVDMPQGDTKARLHHVWSVWTRWGVDNPVKRRTLAQLSVSDQVSDISRQATLKMAQPTIDMIADASAKGALSQAPSAYVGALVEASVYTTMDHMIARPDQADSLSEAGFEAVWRMLT